MSVLTAYHGNSHGNVKDDLKFQISADDPRLTWKCNQDKTDSKYVTPLSHQLR